MRDPLYVSIPFFMGLHHGATARARGVLLDAFAPSRFDVAASDASRVGLESVAGGIDLSVFPAPSPATSCVASPPASDARRYRRSGRWATTSPAGPTGASRRCATWPRSCAHAASRPT